MHLFIEYVENHGFMLWKDIGGIYQPVECFEDKDDLIRWLKSNVDIQF